MKLTRPAIAVAAAAALVVAGSAGAVTKPRPKPKPKPVKPVCNLVTDGTKDTFLLRTQDSQGAYGPQEDALDIVSADLASNATTLTAVIRVVKLSKSVQTAPGGIDYRVSFVLPGEDPKSDNLFLDARIDAQGTQAFLLGQRTNLPVPQSTTAKLADGTGTFDTTKNEVRISVPLSAVKAGSTTLAPGMKIDFAGLDQTSARNVVVNPATGVGTATFADVANSTKTYVAGTLSCVTPGK